MNQANWHLLCHEKFQAPVIARCGELACTIPAHDIFAKTDSGGTRLLPWVSDRQFGVIVAWRGKIVGDRRRTIMLVANDQETKIGMIHGVLDRLVSCYVFRIRACPWVGGKGSCDLSLCPFVVSWDSNAECHVTLARAHVHIPKEHV
eukprot:SAG31_NODE_2193_length_6224_cov_3.425469_5_plen_147_part_00